MKFRGEDLYKDVDFLDSEKILKMLVQSTVGAGNLCNHQILLFPKF